MVTANGTGIIVQVWQLLFDKCWNRDSPVWVSVFAFPPNMFVCYSSTLEGRRINSPWSDDQWREVCMHLEAHNEDTSPHSTLQLLNICILLEYVTCPIKHRFKKHPRHLQSSTWLCIQFNGNKYLMQNTTLHGQLVIIAVNMVTALLFKGVSHSDERHRIIDTVYLWLQLHLKCPHHILVL